MKVIKKIKIKNFGRFKDISIELNDNLNLLIGDNEAGKSTILNAIDLVLSGSHSKVVNYGLEHLFNTEVVEAFLVSDKKHDELPELFVELYLNDQGVQDLEGKYNSEQINAHGLTLVCEPRQDLSKEIKDILAQESNNFPFEYYSISFKTFSGEAYTGYRRFMQHVLLDNSQTSSHYANRAYVNTMYNTIVQGAEKNKHQNEYRNHKEVFRENVLSDLNEKIDDYSFSIKTSSKANLESDLTIKEGNIEIENKGKGRQCFIKTDFALQKHRNELDLILLEEPENHLSHVNTKKLIRRIDSSEEKQLIIATHSNLISTRLDLRKSILLNSTSQVAVKLKNLPVDTAKFFIKAPDNNILEFILSEKVILVEGDAEFILMEAFFEKEVGEKIESSDIHIISVGGTSFKRYLDIAKLLNIKTAVIRDNDSDFQENCVERYAEYNVDNIQLFYSEDNDCWTFEVAVYESNSSLCDELFLEGRRSLSVQDYMLKNKADAAFEILDEKAVEIEVPEYIKEAIQWIRN